MAKSKKITKRDIINSAEQLLIASNSCELSIGDIAKYMKVSKGTIYYHYSAREEILFDIMHSHMTELREEFVLWLGRHHDDFTVDRFLSVLLYKGVKLFNRSKIHIFLISQCLNKDSVIAAKLVDYYQQWRQTIVVAVKRAFGSDSEYEVISDMLLMIIDGLAIREVLAMESDNNKIISLLQQWKVN